MILKDSQLLGHLLYLTFLHPSAKYPGPFIARYTNLYAAYHAWVGDIHRDVRLCHDIYGVTSCEGLSLGFTDSFYSGPRVRYGPNKLLFDDSRAINGEFDRT
jgi:hypothetical protein